MKVLTIERAKWRRGGPFLGSPGPEIGETFLLNRKGLMCCLGFDALACGLKPEEIYEIAQPGDIALDVFFDGANKTEPKASIAPNYVYYLHNRYRPSHAIGTAIGDAIRANDNTHIDEPKRERLVREALMKLGWDDVVFV